MAFAFDVRHTTFVFAFRPGSVRPAGAWFESPVTGELFQPLGKHQDLSLRIVLTHQGASVIHEHLLRHAAPVPESLLQRLKPVVLLLAAERPDQQSPGVSQGEHRQVHPHPFPTYTDHALAKVRLQLPARRRLKPHRRQCRVAQLTPPWLNRTLHRAQAHLDSLLAGQLLPHHIGVAAMGPKPLPQPLSVAIENRGSTRLAIGLPTTLP